MAAIDQHLLKVRSPVDGREIPYHVSAPSPLPKTRLPVVFLLHDTVVDPAPGAFVEESFRIAADWKAALADGPPGLLVQPWGRGNAAWLGPAGRALFDVWRRLEEQFLVAETAAVVGFGAGATGAFQLAAHVPERFHAVAALNPWSDERLFGSLAGAVPAWEEPARKSARPVDLAGRLSGKTILLGRASTEDALTSLAARRHLEAMAAALERAGIAWRDVSPKGAALAETGSINRTEIWLALAAAPSSADGVAGRSNLDFPFWRATSIVVGTLGETDEVALLRGLAQRLRERWLSGDDSGRHCPGDRGLVQEIPIITDSEAVAETPEGDLYLLGSPRLNLLTAKWSNQLGLQWPAEDRDDFAALGRTFADAAAFAVVRSARPDGEEGRVSLVTTASQEAWLDVVRVRFALLPEVFVQSAPGEILWMKQDEE